MSQSVKWSSQILLNLCSRHLHGESDERMDVKDLRKPYGITAAIVRLLLCCCCHHHNYYCPRYGNGGPEKK